MLSSLSLPLLMPRFGKPRATTETAHTQARGGGVWKALYGAREALFLLLEAPGGFRTAAL